MASLGKALPGALASIPAVAAITSVVIPNTAPQREVYPQIVYEVKERKSDQVYSGTSSAPVNAKLTIQAIDKTYQGADALGEAIRGLDGTGGAFNGVLVNRFWIEEDSDTPFTMATSENLTRYCRELTFDVWFYE